MRMPMRVSALLLLLPAAALGATSFNCGDILLSKKTFDLTKLGGPHVVYQVEDDGLSVVNHTYTFDLCHPLKKTKGIDKKDDCPNFTRVCGIDYVTRREEKTAKPEKVIPIAGDYIVKDGRGWNPQYSLLRDSKSHSDSEKEGLRIQFDGGRFPPADKKNGTPQMAVFELICDPDHSGLGDDEDESKGEDRRRAEKGDDKGDDKDDDDKGDKGDKDGEGDDKGDGKDDKKEKEKEPTSGSDTSLRFVSYRTEDTDNGETGVLRLEWKTKYACEKTGRSTPSKQASWGFFTWFLIILFLAIAAYLIFGSWLNYNRYGARGWDLLPHGDTIRDIPYLVKDWGRRVVSTVQGGGSRGGYSAV